MTLATGAKNDVKPVKKLKKRKEGMSIGHNVTIPEGVDRFRVMRCSPVHPFPEIVPCAAHVDGMRKDMFDIRMGLPSIENVKIGWGSAAYRFSWFRAGGTRPAGHSTHFVIDDPAYPEKPVYSGPEPAAPAAPAKPEPLPSSGDPMIELMKATADSSGKLDIGVALVFISAMAQQQASLRNEQEAQYRRWQGEDQRRAEMREREHEREIERERERAASERADTETFWTRQNKAALEMRREASGDEEREDVAEMRDAIAGLSEVVSTQSKRQQDMWDKVFEVVGPAIPSLIQKFTGGGTPQMGGG